MKEKRTAKSPANTVGLVVALAAVAVAAWAVMEFMASGKAEPAPAATPAVVAAPVEAPKGFAAVEGPPPGADTPYPGALAAWTRWSDADGEHMVTLSVVKADERADPASAERTGARAVAVAARHYLLVQDGARLLAERVDSAPPDAAVPSAGFYKDGVWAADADGDGRGEALFAYWIDDSPEPGPKRLVLVAFSGDRALTISGSTRFDPAEGDRSAPVTLVDDGMSKAPGALLAEATGIWEEAQFDLAEPPAYPGFFRHRRFDGATFRSDEPFWTLTVLPQYMLLKFAGDEKPAVIRYEAIRDEEAGLVIEGKGEVEAWSHGFRVTIAERPTPAPGGETFPLAATVDWSDGTRLSGWGALAE